MKGKNESGIQFALVGKEVARLTDTRIQSE